MIIKEIKKGETKIKIDDEFMPKTEEERQERYEIFNAIACQILLSSNH